MLQKAKPKAHLMQSYFAIILSFIALLGLNPLYSQDTGTPNPYELCESPCPYAADCEQYVCNGDLDVPLDYPSAEGQVYYMCPWTNAFVPDVFGGVDYLHGGTPDYFHSSGTNNIDLSGPFGTQANCTAYGASSSVGGYFGLFTYEVGQPSLSHREYIQSKFVAPLPSGSATISFYVSLGDNSQFTSEFGVYLSATRPTFPGGALYTQDITPASGMLIMIPDTFDNKSAWEQVVLNVTIPVNSNYQYITIGNFENNANTSRNTATGGTDPRTYYFIDEIRVDGQTSIAECCGFNFLFTGKDFNDPPQSWKNVVGTLPVNSSAYMEGNWLIDTNVTLNGVTIAFGPFSTVYMGQGRHLNLQNSTLKACDTMWQGIVADSANCKITMDNSNLYDAEIGILARNGNELDLEGNIFDRNRIHIKIENGGTWPLTFKNNRLRCSNILKAPYTSQFTDVGFYINNVSHANLAPLTTIADKNQFSKANIGLYIENSEVRLANSEFASMNTSAGSSWCVWAKAGANLRILDIVDRVTGSPILANTFKNSDNGIHIEGAAPGQVFEANIKNNILTDIVGTGIEVYNHINPVNNINHGHIIITGNAITKNGSIGMNKGIWVHRTDRMFVNIESNTISNNGSKLGSIGIEVTNPSFNFLPIGVNPPAFYTILLNNVTKFTRGIYTDFLSLARIQTNTIDLNGTGTDQYHGIWARSTQSSNIFTNTVSGDYQDWRSIGIRVENDFGVQVVCNEVEQTGIALWFQLNNSPGRVIKNIMEDYANGMVYSSASVGIQALVGNQPYILKNEWEKTSTNKELVRDSATNRINNRYYLYTPAGPYSQNITDFASISTTGGPGIAFFDSGISGTAETRPDPYEGFCPAINVTVVKPHKNDIRHHLRQDSLMVLFVEENQWHSSRQLYSFLRQNIDFLDSLTEIEDWYDSVHVTNTRLFFGTYQYLAAGEFDSAHACNDSITGINDMEDEYQVFLNFLIDEYESAYSLGEGYELIDRDQMEDMADNCPIQYGDLVFMARRFLLDVAGDEEEIISECEEEYYRPEEEEESAKKAGTNDNEAQYYVSMYPNPADEQIRVETNFKGTFEMLDIAGKIVQTGEINAGFTTLSTESILPGIYNFVILKDSIVLQSNKLVIIH